MSDTSTLIAIKYKGQMIELPKDSSVSWNDLEDKPIIIDTSTVTEYYDIVSYQPIRNLMQSGSGYGDSYQGAALYVLKTSITDAISALSSLLSDDLKKIWRIEWVENGQIEWEIEATIDFDNEDILYFSGDLGITLRSLSLVDDGDYWKILVNDPNNDLDDDISVTVDVLPVNFITSDNQTVTSFTYTVLVPGEWYFDPDHIKEDASLGILWDTSMNGGSTDLSDYYTKTQIDTSIANNYASKNDISVFITSNDVSIYLTDNDISTFITSNDISTFITANDISTFVTDNDVSTFITANDISTKLEANDVSLFITSNDISTFITANDVSIYSTNTYVNSTFAKISYISLSDYDNLQVKDPSTLYIIPS